MATCCTEYVLLEPKHFPEAEPTRKRRRKSRKKTKPKRTKIDWPKIAPGFLRIFVMNDGVPVYRDIEKAQELEELRASLGCQNMETLVVAMGCFWGAERLFWKLPGATIASPLYHPFAISPWPIIGQNRLGSPVSGNAGSLGPAVGKP